jgi:hypothetical protein
MTPTSVKLDRTEYEAIYRVLITSSVENLAEQRNLNEVLEALEKVGEPIGPNSDNGVPRMYTIDGDVSVAITPLGAATLRQHLDKGVGRFQAWATRSIPAVLERLEALPN